MDLSVILPVISERDNLTAVIPRLGAQLAREGADFETIAVDGGSLDGTQEEAAGLGARVVRERRRWNGICPHLYANLITRQSCLAIADAVEAVTTPVGSSLR